MILQLIDGGYARRWTAVAEIQAMPPGQWETQSPWPDVTLEGKGNDACVGIFIQGRREHRRRLQGGPCLDMGPVSLITFGGIRWLGPDVLSFRLLLRNGFRTGTFERFLTVDLAQDPVGYVVRDLASGRGADVCAIPSVERQRVWVQVGRQDDEGRLAGLSIYVVPDDSLKHSEGFPVLVEACGRLVGHFTLSELTSGDYVCCDASTNLYVDWLVADTNGVVRMSIMVEKNWDSGARDWEAMYELTVFPDGRHVVERLSELLDPNLWTIL